MSPRSKNKKIAVLTGVADEANFILEEPHQEPERTKYYECIFDKQCFDGIHDIGAEPVVLNYNGFNYGGFKDAVDALYVGGKGKDRREDIIKVKTEAKGAFDDLKKQIKAKLEQLGTTNIMIPGNWNNLIEPGVAEKDGRNRDIFTMALCDVVMEDPDLKLFAVCGGMQAVAYNFGGGKEALTTVEKLAPSDKKHHDPHKPEVFKKHATMIDSLKSKKKITTIDLTENSIFFDIPEPFMKNRRLRVPSAHTQCINPEARQRLEEAGLYITGWGEGNVPESIESSDNRIATMQGHPEEMPELLKFIVQKLFKIDLSQSTQVDNLSPQAKIAR